MDEALSTMSYDKCTGISEKKKKLDDLKNKFNKTSQYVDKNSVLKELAQCVASI